MLKLDNNTLFYANISHIHTFHGIYRGDFRTTLYTGLYWSQAPVTKACWSFPLSQAAIILRKTAPVGGFPFSSAIQTLFKSLPNQSVVCSSDNLLSC